MNAHINLNQKKKIKKKPKKQKTHTHTHTSETTILSGDGERDSEEENRKLGPQQNLLQIAQEIPQKPDPNTRNQRKIRFLPERRRRHIVGRAAVSHLLAQNLDIIPILQQPSFGRRHFCRRIRSWFS